LPLALTQADQPANKPHRVLFWLQLLRLLLRPLRRRRRRLRSWI
jgi:hypothetical protein